MSESGSMEGSFHLMGGDFTHAGSASSELKAKLIGFGVAQSIVRRAAIAAFEAEMNVIIEPDSDITPPRSFLARRNRVSRKLCT